VRVFERARPVVPGDVGELLPALRPAEHGKSRHFPLGVSGCPARPNTRAFPWRGWQLFGGLHDSFSTAFAGCWPLSRAADMQTPTSARSGTSHHRLVPGGRMGALAARVRTRSRRSTCRIPRRSDGSRTRALGAAHGPVARGTLTPATVCDCKIWIELFDEAEELLLARCGADWRDTGRALASA